jgi:hypothetical protein
MRVEYGEDHLCEEDNGGAGRWVASILISLAGVAGGCLFLWEHMDPRYNTVQLWKVTYAKAWTHNPVLETLPLWVLCLFGTVLVAVT